LTGFVTLEMATKVASTIVIVGVAAVLTPRYGLTGAAVSVLLYTIVRNVAKTYLLYRRVHMTALSFSLLRPLLAATVASILVAGINEFTSLGSSLLGTAALGTLLVVAYAFILLRVVGISSVDRRTLRLAFRP
jgi:O-antigen/teichoic acid export membrane protein